jgi:hypothetical protein
MANDDRRNGANPSGIDPTNDAGGSGPTFHVPDSSNQRAAVPDAGEPSPGRRVRRVRRDDIPGAGAGDIVAELEASARAKRTPPPYDPDTADQCPLFWQLVTQDQTKTGEQRLLPDVKLTRVPGGWLCAIQDVETAQETRFTFEALRELALAAERHLTSGKAVWLPFKSMKNPKGIDRHKQKNA